MDMVNITQGYRGAALSSRSRRPGDTLKASQVALDTVRATELRVKIPLLSIHLPQLKYLASFKKP